METEMVCETPCPATKAAPFLWAGLLGGGVSAQLMDSPSSCTTLPDAQRWHVGLLQPAASPSWSLPADRVVPPLLPGH